MNRPATRFGARIRRALQALARRLSASWLVPPTFRLVLLRAGGCNVGKALILDGVTVLGRQLHVEDGAFINQGALVEAHAPVTIRSGASVAMRCRIITSTHDLGTSAKRAGRLVCKPVTIEEGAWLGAGVTVLPGVVVGRGSVVGAGSIVTRDVPANTLVVGSPARVVRALDATNVQR